MLTAVGCACIRGLPPKRERETPKLSKADMKMALERGGTQRDKYDGGDRVEGIGLAPYVGYLATAAFVSFTLPVGFTGCYQRKVGGTRNGWGEPPCGRTGIQCA